AVSHENVVRDPDRDSLVVDRIYRISARKDPGLGALRAHPLDLGLILSASNVGINFGFSIWRRYVSHQRMLRRQHHKGSAEERIRPRRKHANDGGRMTNDGFAAVAVRRPSPVVRRNGEINFRPLAPPDPLALLLLDPFWPVD